jgi:uncharacterized membrane protein
MKPLVILITVFAAYILASRVTTGFWNLSLGGNLAMCIMLCFTALGHFLFTRGMVMMIPSFIPYKTALVYITAFAEVILGLALLSPSLRPYAGCALILFFVLILQANVYASVKHLDIEKGTNTGPGLSYLWFRIPLQLFFIAWIYYFSICLNYFSIKF